MIKKKVKITKEKCYWIGKKLSEEHKRKMSKSQMGHRSYWKGKNRSKETCKKMSIIRLGKKLSDETKQKLKIVKLGMRHSEESKQKICIANLGRKYSDETIKKLKKSNKNKQFSKETRLKIKLKALGRKHSLETRRKMRLAALKYISKCYGRVTPHYNPKSIAFFNLINRTFNLIGQHAENGGEFFIKKLGFWVDYYEPNLNLVIEWNENTHYDNYGLTKKHYLRQLEIELYLGCVFINVREREYEKFPFKVLSHIKKIIGKQVVIKRKLR